MEAPKRKLPPALAANVWKPGQSGNPAGHSGLYGETVKLARQAAPAAIRRLIELMASDDERVATVACNAVLDRAFGRPRDYDPKEETDQPPPFDVSLLTREERAELRRFCNLVLKARGVPVEAAKEFRTLANAARRVPR